MLIHQYGRNAFRDGIRLAALGFALLLFGAVLTLASCDSTTEPRYVLEGRVLSEVGPGVPGVTLELAGAAITRGTVTDETGGYRFSDLEAGQYSLRVLPPSGMTGERLTVLVRVPEDGDVHDFTLSPIREPETWTATVGPDGGTLVLADGAVQVDVPPGALSETVTISLQEAAGVRSGFPILRGTAYTFSPTGLSFEVPATLTLSYDSGQTDEPERLSVYRIDGSSLSILPGTVDPPAQAVSADVTEFSTFAIGEIELVSRTCDTDGSPWRWPVCSGSRKGLGQTYAQFLPWESRGWEQHHHTGLDIGPGGREVVAVAAGRVIARCRDGVTTGCEGFSSNETNHGLDGVVILEHEWEGKSVYTLYAHMTGESVQKHTPPSGTDIESGRVLGIMNDKNHVHFEVKREPVLHNPVELEESCVNASEDPENQVLTTRCWGYVLRHPDDHGFLDPVVFLHEVNPISQARMEVTSDGGGAALRIGPGPYRIVKDPSGSEARVQTGNQFDVELEAPPTDDPECELGWVQVRLPDDRYFDDLRSLGGDETLPRAWLCRGHEGREWIRFVEDEVRGRVVDQFAEIPLSSVTVTSSDGSVTTDFEGRFTVPVASSDDELVFSSSGIHTRRTFGQGSDLDWRVIPADFEMDLFDEVARHLGDLIDVAENDRTHKWTGGSPQVFIDTRNHEDDPKYAPGHLPQQIQPHVAEYMGLWSAGTVSPEQVTLTDSPPADGSEGTVVIRFVDLSDEIRVEQGDTTWALGRTSPWAFWDRYEIVAGVIELDMVSSGLNMDPRLVVGREIGHIFGMGQFHQDRPFMMRAVTPPPGTEFSEFEAKVADIVYSRLPGTRSPDTEERPAAGVPPRAQEQPVGGPFLSWVRHQ